MPDKATLRKQMLERRQAASPGLIAAASQKICGRFFSEFDLTAVHTLHVFLSIPDKNELDTWPIIRSIWREFPHIQVAVPVTPPGAVELKHRLVTPDSKLLISKWGIPEPTPESPKVKEDIIDLVLVPLLVFDEKGHRVGYGKGYYDRFLNKCRTDVLKIGLSIFDPVETISDSGPWDVPLDFCLTPDFVYKF